MVFGGRPLRSATSLMFIFASLALTSCYSFQPLEGQAGKLETMPLAFQLRATYQMAPIPIQIAIATIIRFSVNEMKPSGTSLPPPTQAHLSSRPSR